MGQKMGHRLADASLRMTYLRDPYQIDDLDQDAILRDLSMTGPDHPKRDPAEEPATVRLSHRSLSLSDYGHLILASDRATSQTLALLGVHDGSTGQEDFLHLQTAYVAPVARGRRVADRMIALAMLHIAGNRTVPKVIVARTSNPIWYRSLCRFSKRLTGAVFYPGHDSPAIRLDSVRLALRIAGEVAPNLRLEKASAALRGGRIDAGLLRARPSCNDKQLEALFGRYLQPADQILAVIDLRTQSEDAILENARRIYRAR